MASSLIFRYSIAVATVSRDLTMQCTKCLEVKSLECFHRDKNRLNGRYPHCKTCKSREHKIRYEATSKQKIEQDYYSDIVRKYGLSREEYKLLLQAQKGVCAICEQKPKTHRLCVDHCHRTGKVRGLLCKKCNSALGLLQDDIDLVKSALTYLGAD